MLSPRLRHHGLQVTAGDHRLVTALELADTTAAFGTVAEVTDFLRQGRRHQSLFLWPGLFQPGLALAHSCVPPAQTTGRYPDRLAERFPAQAVLLSQGGGVV